MAPQAPLFTGTTWHDRIYCARSGEEVVRAARDFLASFSPLELNELPAICRPPPKLQEEDIPTYAYELVRFECTEENETADRVHKLAQFFSQAAAQLAHVRATDPMQSPFDERQSA
jgi:hypothetical protein